MRAAIVLAAGASRRFGRIDKLNVRLGGAPLLHHAIRHALASGAGRVIVVTSRCRGMGQAVHWVRAARHREGLSASLAAGLAALRPIEREVLIFLGDTPFAAMPHGLRLRPGLDAIRPVVGNKPGHPMLVRVPAARAAVVAGDSGLAGRLGRIGHVRGAAGNVIDIDTPAALGRARRMLRRDISTKARRSLQTPSSPRTCSGARGATNAQAAFLLRGGCRNKSGMTMRGKPSQ